MKLFKESKRFRSLANVFSLTQSHLMTKMCLIDQSQKGGLSFVELRSDEQNEPISFLHFRLVSIHCFTLSDPALRINLFFLISIHYCLAKLRLIKNIYVFVISKLLNFYFMNHKANMVKYCINICICTLRYACCDFIELFCYQNFCQTTTSRIARRARTVAATTILHSLQDPTKLDVQVTLLFERLFFCSPFSHEPILIFNDILDININQSKLDIRN